MKQISLNITDNQEKAIQKIINLGLFPDRSAAIRFFIHEGINETIKLVEKIRGGVLDCDQHYFEKFYKLVHGRIHGKRWMPKLLDIKKVS